MKKSNFGWIAYRSPRPLLSRPLSLARNKRRRREYDRAASLLGAIVIVPFAIGCIKLAVGPSLMKVSSLLERSLIYIFISLFNVSAAAWTFKYGRIMGEQRSHGWPPADQAFNDFLFFIPCLHYPLLFNNFQQTFDIT